MQPGSSSALHGFGLGLRPPHYPAIEAGVTGIDWFEIISENFMVRGGPPLRHLTRIRADYPMVMHGVSLSIGSTSPLDRAYLGSLRELATRVEPAWISDHLCWTGIAGLNMHDLLPLPFTEEALAHVAARVDQVQDFLGRPLLLENTSSYVAFVQSALSEWDFLAELVRRTGCRLLLDVNNVHVNAVNHGFRATEFIDALPAGAVWQIHLAGHQDNGSHIVDTHDQPVADAVWQLYAYTIARLGAVPTMIERDDHIPPLPELVAELDRAREVTAAARQPNPAREVA